MSWPLVKISDFCLTGSGGTPSREVPEYYQGDIPWIKSGDLRENIVTSATEFISREAIQKSSAKIVSSGAILVAMYGATVGRMALLGIDAATNQAVCNITPDASRADTKYVYYALLSKVPEFLRSAIGGAQPNISQGLIRSTEILLPPLSEQNRIASILDKADAIRRKRQQAIKLADDFLRAVFLDMFGDPVTNPKGWEVKALADVCKKITDGTHHSPPIADTGVPYITAKHLKKTGLQFFNDPWFISEEDHRAIYSRCAPEKDDVLYIKDGATTGLAAINEYDFEFSMLSSLALLKPDREKILPEYLTAFLNHPRTKQVMIANMAGAAITRLTLAKIKSVRTPIPPIEMQQKFTDVYVKVREMTRKVSSGVDASVNAFEAISQKAFSGQL